MALYIAACILVVLCAAHSYLGERYLLIRLFQRGNLPTLIAATGFTEGTLRFVWHMVSVFGTGVAFLLVQLQQGGGPAQATATLGWTLVLAALLPLYFTRGRHLSWVGLAAAGILCLL